MNSAGQVQMCRGMLELIRRRWSRRRRTGSLAGTRSRRHSPARNPWGKRFLDSIQRVVLEPAIRSYYAIPGSARRWIVQKRRDFRGRHDQRAAAYRGRHVKFALEISFVVEVQRRVRLIDNKPLERWQSPFRRGAQPLDGRSHVGHAAGNHALVRRSALRPCGSAKNQHRKRDLPRFSKTAESRRHLCCLHGSGAT